MPHGIRIVRPLIPLLTMLGGALATEAAAAPLPRFEDFAVAAEVLRAPTPPNTRCDLEAKRYRAMLRAGARQGPNFAGHYTIVTWGCGTACRRFAIVDARSGKVHFAEALRYVVYPGLADDVPPFRFRQDSRLLVVNGSPNGDARDGSYYFLWQRDRLGQIEGVPATTDE